MTIPRVRLPTWALGDKLNPEDVEAFEDRVTSALDKRSGQTDEIGSVVVATGAGRIVSTVATGADGNTTYQIDGGNSVIRVTGAVIGNRTYTLSDTGAVTGDEITIYCEPSFVSYEVTIKDAAANTLYVLGNLSSSDGTWASFTYVGGWRLFRGGQGSRLRAHKVLVAGTTSFVIPPGVTSIHALLVGGGGGGGGGATGDARVLDANGGGGGGGGGGARLVSTVLSVTPGESLVLSAAGGGLGGTAGVHGSDGGDTHITGGALAIARGAMGGAAGTSPANTAMTYRRGGEPVKNNTVGTTADGDTQATIPGRGGRGYRYPRTSSPVSIPSAAVGGGTAVGAGGAGGTWGTSTGTGSSDKGGGGGGGGGGASEWAGMVAGAGGAGGAGDLTGGTGGTGGTGTFGSGGGGGGGGGASDFAGPMTGSDGGDGGQGGNGAIVLLFVK